MNEEQPYILEGVDYVTAGDTLLKWMGTLWTAFSDDPEFVKRYQQAKGMIAAQFAVNYQETASLSDRRRVPVYHRERWMPMVLQTADQNTGKAASARLGDDYVPVIGQQLASPFILGSKIEIGGYYPLQSITTYALPPGQADVASVIVDNPAQPSIVLVRGIDFYVENETIFFLHDTDPLSSGAFVTNTVQAGKQALIWLSDAMIDRRYLQNFLGYVLGVFDDSSEFYKRYLNALWDLYNKGATVTEFTAGLAAMLGEATVINDTETVEHILESADKRQVITDAHVYDVVPSALLRDSVVVGATLRRGELLTQTIKLYQNLDPIRVTADAEYGATIRDDIPAFLVPSHMFRAPLRYGLGISWERVAVTSSGSDANGNPKLRFDLYGDPDDVTAFWEDFWDYCLVTETSSVEYFDNLSAPAGVFGYYGSIIPFEFFLSNFLKANTLFVTVNSSQLSAQGRKGLGYLGLLADVVPKHVYVSILERQSLGPEEYEEYDEAPLVVDAALLREVAAPGNVTTARLGYEDRVSARWIPVCV